MLPPAAITLLTALLLLPAGARAADSTVLLTIDSFSRSDAPEGERIGFVSGRALATHGKLPQFEVVFLIDVSGSTGASAGVDIDGDGRVGTGLGGMFKRRRSGDTILAAEIAAVDALIDTFDPRTTRVGVVSFSGGEQRDADAAMLDVALTSDYRRARRGLQEILLGGPDGWTNLYGGLRVAAAEVGGGRMAESEPRPGAQRHILVLTDGYPLVPYESPEQSESRAIRLAGRLGDAGIRVHTYAIGPDANDRPRAAVQVARASGGDFTAVRDPSELEKLLGEASFASIDEVRVRNVDTGKPAEQVVRNADGSYAALVALRPGENTIEVYARATDGVENTVRRTGTFGAEKLAPRERADLARLQVQARRRKAQGSIAVEVESEP